MIYGPEKEGWGDRRGRGELCRDREEERDGEMGAYDAMNSSQSSFLHSYFQETIVMSVYHCCLPVVADKESTPQKADGLFR